MSVTVSTLISSFTFGAAASIPATCVVTARGSTTPVAGLTFTAVEKTVLPAITASYEVSTAGIPNGLSCILTGNVPPNAGGIDNFMVDLTTLVQQAALSVAASGSLSTVGTWGTGSCAVSGQATSAGLPVSRADLSIYDSGLTFLGAMQTEEGGNFILNLDPATYYVKFNPSGNVILYRVVVPSAPSAFFDQIATRQ